ncbi:ATP-binding protein [Ferrovibrio terrae]|uniref:sensor histidine kinase n=1 Tax=Ferrovibrio terrae TaxID=2594003 RepID=UPI00313794A2
MALVLMVAWGVTAVAVLGDRERIYRSASAEVTGAIPVLRLHARRSMDTAHAILVAIDEALQVGGDSVDLNRLSDLAVRMQSSDEDPIGIAIIDSTERLIQIEGNRGNVFVGDREYMAAIRGKAPGELHIGEPLSSRTSGRAVIPMVMVARSNAAHVGFILAAMPVASFEEAYRDLLISAPSAIGLARNDGLVLHLTPDPKGRVGKKLPGFDLEALRQRYAPMTAFDQDRTADLGLRIIASYAMVEPYPVVVVAALREQSLRESWHAATWPKLAALVTGTAIVVALTAWLFVLMSRRDAALKRVTEALIEVDTANRAKRDFMARMSHELRTPLNAILGFSELISGAMVGPLAKTYQDYGRDIHRSGDHLLGMINQVLDITRIEAGVLKLELAPVELEAMAEEVTAILRPLANARDISIRFEIDPEARRLMADPMMLRQMLLNLISNALKFSPPGQSVTVVARAAEGGVALSVQDRGPGIQPDKLPHLFEPFGSGQSMLADQNAGLGLGLPIVKKLLEMHGGELSITTGPDAGTAITLQFPPASRLAA